MSGSETHPRKGVKEGLQTKASLFDFIGSQLNDVLKDLKAYVSITMFVFNACKTRVFQLQKAKNWFHVGIQLNGDKLSYKFQSG